MSSSRKAHHRDQPQKKRQDSHNTQQIAIWNFYKRRNEQTGRIQQTHDPKVFGNPTRAICIVVEPGLGNLIVKGPQTEGVNDAPIISEITDLTNSED